MPTPSKKLKLSLAIGTDGARRVSIFDQFAEVDEQAALDAFYPYSATYDAGLNRIAVGFIRGRQRVGGTLIAFSTDQVYYVAAPAINTTYYIYLNSAGEFVQNTTGALIAGATVICRVATGAAVETITLEDLRGQFPDLAIAEIHAEIDGSLHGTTGHNHTGDPGEGPRLTAASLVAEAATDTVIGNRTINQDLATPGITGTVTQLLSWLAGRIKAILGGPLDWNGVPPITLTGAKTRLDTVDQNVTVLGQAITNHANATTVGTHGSTAAATANTPMHRDAEGRAKVAAPAAADDIARFDTVTAAADTATEEGLVVEHVLPVTNAEPDQVQTSKGPAVQFANAVTQSVTWCRRYPFGANACKVELVLAADVASANSFRVRVAWQVNGGAATNVDVTVTPGNNTNLFTADLGIIVPDASVAAGQLITFTLSRLGADAADTHTGNLLVYHTRLKRG